MPTEPGSTTAPMPAPNGPPASSATADGRTPAEIHRDAMALHRVRERGTARAAGIAAAAGKSRADIEREYLQEKRAALARGVEGSDVFRRDACPTCGAFPWYNAAQRRMCGPDHDPVKHAVHDEPDELRRAGGRASTPAIDLDAIRRRREANDDD